MLLVYKYLLLKLRAPEPEENGGGAPEEKKQKKVEKEPEQQDTVALAKALKEARENSVPRSEFDKVVKEKEALVSEIINGEGAGSGQPKPDEQKKPTIEELKEKLYGPKCSELSNLEYWKNTLALRRAVIEKGDPDPFLPIGNKISPTKEDIEKAQNVEDVVQECIDECDGNSEVFTALLQSRTNNDSPALTLRLAKLGVKYK